MNNFKKGGFSKGGGDFGGRPKFGGNKFGGGRPGGNKFGGGGHGGGKKFGGDRDGKPTESFPATCSDCGKSCEVPFRPSSEKPVYCSNCFGMKKSDSENSNRSNFSRPQTEQRPSNNERFAAKPDAGLEDVKRQLTVIEARLNRILDLINPPMPAAKAPVLVVEKVAPVVEKAPVKKVAKVVEKAPAKKAVTKVVAKKEVKKVVAKTVAKKVVVKKAPAKKVAKKAVKKATK